jgi:hypothetical protein
MILVGYGKNFTERLDMGNFPTYSLILEGKNHTNR